MLLKVMECFRTFWAVPQCSKLFSTLQCPLIVWNVLDNSEMFWNLSDYS